MGEPNLKNSTAINNNEHPIKILPIVKFPNEFSTFKFTTPIIILEMPIKNSPHMADPQDVYSFIMLYSRFYI